MYTRDSADELCLDEILVLISQGYTWLATQHDFGIIKASKGFCLVWGTPVAGNE